MLFDIEAVAGNIKIGDGTTLQAAEVGSLKVQVVQLDGTEQLLTVTKVQLVPDLCCNLFFITQALEHGFHVAGTKDKGLKLSKGATAVTFDRCVSTPNGYLLGVQVIRVPPHDVALIEQLVHGAKMNINDLHQKLGHRLKATASQIGFNLVRETIVCEDCAIAKARQTNIPKENVNRSVIPGEQLYLDISGINHKKLGGTKFWLLVLDDATSMLIGGKKGMTMCLGGTMGRERSDDNGGFANG